MKKISIIFLTIVIASCKKQSVTPPYDPTVYCWECDYGTGFYYDAGCMTTDSLNNIHFTDALGNPLTRKCKHKPVTHAYVSLMYNNGLNGILDSSNLLQCQFSSLGTLNIPNHTSEFLFLFYNYNKNNNPLYANFSILDDSLNTGNIPVGKWLRYARNPIPDSIGYDTRFCNFTLGTKIAPISTNYKDGYLNVLITRSSNNTIDGQFSFVQNYIDSPSVIVQRGAFNNIPLLTGF